MLNQFLSSEFYCHRLGDLINYHIYILLNHVCIHRQVLEILYSQKKTWLMSFYILKYNYLKY